MTADRQSDELNDLDWDRGPWGRDIGDAICAVVFVAVIVALLAFVAFVKGN